MQQSGPRQTMAWPPEEGSTSSSLEQTQQPAEQSTPTGQATHRLLEILLRGPTWKAVPWQFLAKLSSTLLPSGQWKQAAPPTLSMQQHSSTTPMEEMSHMPPRHRRQSQSYISPPRPIMQQAPMVPSEAR